jgi:PAS domain S-box-containing protein
MRPQQNILQPAAWLALLAAILIVTVSTILSYRAWTDFRLHNEQSIITRQVVDNVNGLLSSLKDAETGQRGFLLTGQDEYLEPYRQALKDIPIILQSLAALESSPEPEPVERIEKLRALARERLERLGEAIELRRHSGIDAASQWIGSGRGRALMAQVREVCRDIVAISDERSKRQSAAAERSMNRLGLVSTLGSATLIVILLFATVTLRRISLSRQELIRNLEQNQEFLTSFVRGVPAAAALLDRDLRYLQASDRWCSDYGLDSSQLRGRSHYEIFPDLPQRWKEVHSRALRGETLRAEEDVFEREGGERRWLRWEVRPWGDRDGRPEGILIFSEDITQRKEIEETVRTQRGQLDKIIATAPGAVCELRLRPDGSISLPYTSAGFQKMFPELPDLREDATPLFEMMHPEDLPRIRAEIVESARNLTPWRGDYRVLTPNRGQIWVEGSSVPEQEPDGSIHWYGFLANITESKRLDEALREREAISQALFDTAAQGIVGIDEHGTIQLANQMAETLCGYQNGELIGLSIENLLPENLRQRHAAHRAAFNINPRNRPMGEGMDLQGRRKDGSEFPVEVSLTYLKTSRGLLIVGFLTDITIRKRAELSLRQSEQELHRLAANLLTAQEDERRRLARDLHDDVTQELGLLSSTIDQLILDAPPVDEMHEHLNRLLTRVDRTLGKIRQVSHGLHPSIIEDLGLCVALNELCGEFREVHRIAIGFECSPDGIELTRSVPPETAFCLYRIGQECLQNAAKHSRANEILITIKNSREAIELSVSDDGVGFSTTDQGRAGLGIVSMKERMRAVGGSLSITSQPGKGTMIRARVPLPEGASRKVYRESGVF